MSDDILFFIYKYLACYRQIRESTNWWYIFLIFPENRIWHFMHIVSYETTCMKCQILFSGETKQYFKMLSADFYPACCVKHMVLKFTIHDGTCSHSEIPLENNLIPGPGRASVADPAKIRLPYTKICAYRPEPCIITRKTPPRLRKYAGQHSSHDIKFVFTKGNSYVLWKVILTFNAQRMHVKCLYLWHLTLTMLGKIFSSRHFEIFSYFS